MADERRLVHHELCFGCGRVNLFGLLAEVTETEPGAVAGRCFIKQDHQGPERGHAHPGILAAALLEAISLACGSGASVVELQLELVSQPPVGGFLELTAQTDAGTGTATTASASARSNGRTVASARATLARAA